jgi:hypothetical protein
VDAALNDRVDVKRELKPEELSAFIETIKKRLYLARIAMATGEKEKEEAFSCCEATKVLDTAAHQREQLKLSTMNQMVRSFLKLEKVSERLIDLIKRLRERAVMVELNRLPPQERSSKYHHYKLGTANWQLANSTRVYRQII